MHLYMSGFIDETLLYKIIKIIIIITVSLKCTVFSTVNVL